MSIVEAVVDNYAVHTVTTLRFDGAYSQGRHATNPEPETLSPTGNMQPLRPNQLDQVPEGYRSDGAYMFWTKTEHRTGDAPNTVADQVEWQGVRYLVTAVKKWNSHYRCLLTRLGQ